MGSTGRRCIPRGRGEGRDILLSETDCKAEVPFDVGPQPAHGFLGRRPVEASGYHNHGRCTSEPNMGRTILISLTGAIRGSDSMIGRLRPGSFNLRGQSLSDLSSHGVSRRT